MCFGVFILLLVLDATDLGHDRLLTRFPFECTTVDDLHYYRRRALPGSYRGIVIDVQPNRQKCRNTNQLRLLLSDQRISRLNFTGSRSEPCLPGVTEYQEVFHGWPSINRPPLQRKATNLKILSGSMDVLTEQQRNYVSYSREELLK